MIVVMNHRHVSERRGAQLEVRVNNDHDGAERVTVSLLNDEGNRRSLAR